MNVEEKDNPFTRRKTLPQLVSMVRRNTILDSWQQFKLANTAVYRKNPRLRTRIFQVSLNRLLDKW